MAGLQFEWQVKGDNSIWSLCPMFTDAYCGGCLLLCKTKCLVWILKKIHASLVLALCCFFLILSLTHMKHVMICVGLTSHLHQQPLWWHFLTTVGVRSVELCSLMASTLLCWYVTHLMIVNTFEGHSSIKRFRMRIAFS